MEKSRFQFSNKISNGHREQERNGVHQQRGDEEVSCKDLEGSERREQNEIHEHVFGRFFWRPKTRGERREEGRRG